MKVRAHISAPSLAVARGVARPGTRAVAEEVPVALSYNGTTQAVMMASPADLEDFAAGFTLSEEIVNDLSEIESLTIEAHPNGIEVQMWLAPGAEARLARRRHRRCRCPRPCPIGPYRPPPRSSPTYRQCRWTTHAERADPGAPVAAAR